jgi:hypothetical protein
MASFWLYYNLNKHTSDYDSILWLRPASWAVAVIGPPVQRNIYGIVTSPWTCRQPGHLGSRSGCQAIDTAWSDVSVDLKPHASGCLLLLHTTLALILRCFYNLILFQVDDVIDSHWRAHHRCQLLRDRHVSEYFLLGSWTIYIPHAWCTVHEAALLNGCLEAGETPLTATVWHLGGYKFTLVLCWYPSRIHLF